MPPKLKPKKPAKSEGTPPKRNEALQVELQTGEPDPRNLPFIASVNEALDHVKEYYEDIVAMQPTTFKEGATVGPFKLSEAAACFNGGKESCWT